MCVHIVAPNVKNYPPDVITYRTGFQRGCNVRYLRPWHGTDVCFSSLVQSVSLYDAKVRVTYNLVLKVTFPGKMDFNFGSSLADCTLFSVAEFYLSWKTGLSAQEKRALSTRCGLLSGESQAFVGSEVLVGRFGLMSGFSEATGSFSVHLFSRSF